MHIDPGNRAHEPGGEPTSGPRATPTRKVLVLAYRFPPQGGGGVQRTLKFVKYLPSEGWLPVVQTVSNPYWPLQDTTLLGEVPPFVKVIRTRTFEFERLGRTTDDLLSARDAGTKRSSTPEEARSRRRGGVGRILKGMANLVQTHLLVPDPQIAWVPGALRKSLSAVRREHIRVIYTSSPPNSCQVLGLLVKRLTKLPWVADFRDPWTEGIRRKQSYERSGIRRRLEHVMERAVVNHADHIVVTTEKTLEQFLAKYPSISADKYSVITNGFDPADFEFPPSENPLLDPAQFNMTLTGNIEAMFDAVPFLSALKELIDEDEDIRRRLRVNLVGTKRGKYDAFIEANGLTGNVRYVAYVPHQTSLRYLAESAALFLCQIPVYESATTKLSGKLFEYLYMRKPILALTIPGLTSDILSRSGLGVTVDPHDRPGIKKAVQELYVQWRAGHGPSADEAYIETFDRVRQTSRLAALFELVVERRA